MSALVSSRVRRASCLAAAVAVAATGLAMAGPSASATEETACDGTIGRRMVERVVVPDGATCRLRGTRVGHHVEVGDRATLVARNARVLGSVKATDGPRSVRLLDTDVDGNIHVKEATRRVIIGNSGCRLDPMAGNNIHLKDNSGRIAVCQMSIEGNLHAIGNSGTVFLLSNRVGNNLHARDNTGGFLRLRENRVGTNGSGNLDVDDNRTDVLVRLNRVSNHLDCRDNRRIDGFGNRAADGMRRQCAGLR